MLPLKQLMRSRSVLADAMASIANSEQQDANAKKAAAAEFQRPGFNPQELMKKLKLEIERAVYNRSPY
jgi:hypothetical protein